MIDYFSGFMRRYVLHAGLAAAFLMFGVGASAQSAPDSPQNVNQTPLDRETIGGLAAIVNDYPISQADVIERARLFITGMGVAPTPEQQQQILFQSLEQLIDERLQIAEAKSYNLTIEDGRVDRQMDQVSAQMGMSGKEFEQQLAQSGINPKSFRDQLRAEIAWQEIIQGLYGPGIRISQNRIEAERLRMTESLNKTSYRLSEIFLYTDGEPDVQEEARKAADTLIAQLEKGANFAIIAERLSSSPTAAAGGDKGWVTLESLRPEMVPVVSAATEPGLLPYIETNDGIYILRLDGVRLPNEAEIEMDFAQIVELNRNTPALDQFSFAIKDCEDLRSASEQFDNIDTFFASDIAISGLSDAMKVRLSGLQIGGLSDMFETQQGVARIYVCDRRENLNNLPSDEMIEDNLRQRELSMIADRSLRNLRREATIIRR